MSLKINYKIHSLIARKTLYKNIEDLDKVTEQLSSGKKLRAPKDDAAAFKVSQNLQLSIHNSEYLVSNIEVSKDFMAVAESGLSSVNDNLTRIRALCLRGANSFYNDTQISTIASEISQRLEEIDRMAESVSFRNMPLLNGSCSDLKFQIGTGSTPFENTLNVGSAFIDVHTSALGLDTTIFDEGSYGSPDDFSAYLEKIDNAVSLINTGISKMGTYEFSLNDKQNFLSETMDTFSSYRSGLIDTDVAYASSELAKQQIMENITVALWQQANQIPSTAMQLLR